MVRMVECSKSWLAYLLVNVRLTVCPKFDIPHSERWLFHFQLHKRKPLHSKYSWHLRDQWSWDFYLVNFSKLHVLWSVVRRLRFGAHTHDSGVMTEIILIVSFDFLLTVCLKCSGDQASWDLDFLCDMISFALGLLETSNKLVGGCD